MSLRDKKWYVALVLLVISSWFIADFFEEQKSKKVKVADHTADYFSHGYFKKEMTLQGHVKNKLNADKMIHYGDDDTTHLENPVMILYNAEAPPWVISSAAGIIEADRDNLLLTGEVVIRREAGKKKRAFIINTSELRVKLSVSYAETDEWAEIIDLPNRTEGIGFQTTFVEPIKLKFLSKVKGRYELN